MPWAALPFAERDLKASLSKKFKVNGIPAFVIVDGNGNLVADKGRNGLASDPTALSFPWAPKTFGDIFTGPLVKDGAAAPNGPLVP